MEDINFINGQNGSIKNEFKKVIIDHIARLKGTFTLITEIGGNKSIQSFLEESISSDCLKVVDYKSIDSFKEQSDYIIFDNHLLDQPNPFIPLRSLHSSLNISQELLFFLELQGVKKTGLHKSIAAGESASRFLLDWPIFHKVLLASSYENIWLFEPERAQKGMDVAVISAQVGKKHERPLVSVIMPVYNEVNTFREILNKVLGKEVNGVDIQIIIIESNSTDGTKELVAEYKGNDKVKIIWQEGPKGKGHAVREGLAAAEGDIILIQDADLEYDINDYDALIEELTSWRSNFVLGSRHTGDWKMRKFNKMPIISDLFNFGHIFFTGLINILLGSKMNDPFTMFKVFYRDCVFGLNFRYNRFDFDHELFIKLYRKGFHPVEIPVNYQARSFAEGKKVSIVKDGLSWIIKDFQLAFEPLKKNERA